jgi:hypothetical protein
MMPSPGCCRTVVVTIDRRVAMVDAMKTPEHRNFVHRDVGYVEGKVEDDYDDGRGGGAGVARTR